LGGLLWLLIVVLFVAIIVRLFRGPRLGYWMQGPPSGWMQGPPPDGPEQLLRARFGEIGADEFQQRLDVLRRTSPPPGK
jgi:hypothetical protein